MTKLENEQAAKIAGLKGRIKGYQDTLKRNALMELISKYIMGIINYDQLIFRGNRLGFTTDFIRSKADDPDY